MRKKMFYIKNVSIGLLIFFMFTKISYGESEKNTSDKVDKLLDDLETLLDSPPFSTKKIVKDFKNAKEHYKKFKKFKKYYKEVKNNNFNPDKDSRESVKNFIHGVVKNTTTYGLTASGLIFGPYGGAGGYWAAVGLNELYDDYGKNNVDKWVDDKIDNLNDWHKNLANNVENLLDLIIPEFKPWPEPSEGLVLIIEPPTDPPVEEEPLITNEPQPQPVPTPTPTPQPTQNNQETLIVVLVPPLTTPPNNTTPTTPTIPPIDPEPPVFTPTSISFVTAQIEGAIRRYPGRAIEYEKIDDFNLLTTSTDTFAGEAPNPNLPTISLEAETPYNSGTLKSDVFVSPFYISAEGKSTGGGAFSNHGVEGEYRETYVLSPDVFKPYADATGIASFSLDFTSTVYGNPTSVRGSRLGAGVNTRIRVGGWRGTTYVSEGEIIYGGTNSSGVVAGDGVFTGYIEEEELTTSFTLDFDVNTNTTNDIELLFVMEAGVGLWNLNNSPDDPNHAYVSLRLGSENQFGDPNNPLEYYSSDSGLNPVPSYCFLSDFMTSNGSAVDFCNIGTAPAAMAMSADAPLALAAFDSADNLLLTDDESTIDADAEALSLVASEPISNLTVTKTADASQFSDMTWGDWEISGDSPDVSPPSQNFVTGNLTPVAEIPTEGTATYSGIVKGAVSVQGGNAQALDGTANLEANFADKNMNGSFDNLTIRDTGQVWVQKADVAMGFAGNELNGSITAPGKAGSIDGNFFGAQAAEAGGNWDLAGGGDNAAGIWATKRTDLTVADAIPVEPVASEPQTSEAATQTTTTAEPTTQTTEVTEEQTPPPTTITVTNAADSQQFAFMSWGDWNTTSDSPNVNPPSTPWIAGQLTPGNSIPVSGKATYNGIVKGLVSLQGQNAKALDGSASLNADFAARSMNGSFNNLTIRETGQVWVPQANVNMGWQAGVNQLNGSVNSPGKTGGVSGNFYGPQAEEAGGNWNLSGGGDTAAGIWATKRGAITP